MRNYFRRALPCCRPFARNALHQEVHDRRLRVGRIRRWISVYLPRVSSGFPSIRRHESPDRVVRLVHATVRASVNGDGSLAPRRFGRVHLARSFKCARYLDAEVAQYRCALLCRMVVKKNVVAISPQARLAANELPDLVQCRPPRRANSAWRNLPPHRGQLAGVNSL